MAIEYLAVMAESGAPRGRWGSGVATIRIEPRIVTVTIAKAAALRVPAGRVDSLAIATEKGFSLTAAACWTGLPLDGLITIVGWRQLADPFRPAWIVMYLASKSTRSYKRLGTFSLDRTLRAGPPARRA